MLQGRDEVAQVNNSGNSGGNRTKLMEARIYSNTDQADAKKADAQDRQPLHPVQDNNIIEATSAAAHNKRKTDPSSSSSSRPDTAASGLSSQTSAAAPSILERNVTTTTAPSAVVGSGNIYRPFSNAHGTAQASKAAAPVAPHRDREQSPMKKVIKQLGSLDVKGASGSTPPKCAVPRAAGRPGSTWGPSATQRPARNGRRREAPCRMRHLWHRPPALQAQRGGP